jgi:HTH-type transcriptional regulator/antitoxin HigA
MISKVIHTEEEYNLALMQLEQLMDAQPGTPDGDALELLSLLIEDYEKKEFPIGLPDPIAAIEFRIEQMKLPSSELVHLFGTLGEMQEIMERKRKLTLPLIRSLHVKLNIPSEILIQPY